jgi:hypothetical protein
MLPVINCTLAGKYINKVARCQVSLRDEQIVRITFAFAGSNRFLLAGLESIPNLQPNGGERSQQGCRYGQQQRPPPAWLWSRISFVAFRIAHAGIVRGRAKMVSQRTDYSTTNKP